MLFAADMQHATSKNIICSSSKDQNLTLHITVKSFTYSFYIYFAINSYIRNSLTRIKKEDIVRNLKSYISFQTSLQYSARLKSYISLQTSLQFPARLKRYISLQISLQFPARLKR